MGWEVEMSMFGGAVPCSKCGTTHLGWSPCPTPKEPWVDAALSGTFEVDAAEDSSVRRWTAYEELADAAALGWRRGEALARLERALHNL